MSVATAALLRGRVVQSSAGDNATATGTVAAIANVTHLILGVEAHYDAVVAAIKTIAVKHGSSTFQTFRWDFNNGSFAFSFPVALKADPNEAVTVELQASGTGGINGYASVYVAEN